MPENLDKLSILPKMRSTRETNNTFQLVWPLNLDVNSSHKFIELLFRNIRTGYYLVDKIPPELLSYCTIGTHFKKGKKCLKMQPIGSILDFNITSTDHNQIIDIRDAICDAEFDLSLEGSRYSGEYTNRLSIICKNQKCLLFNVGGTKIVIPCTVLAGIYFFKSTSMREAIFSRNIDALCTYHDFNRDSKHPKIILKPGAADSNAAELARFQISDFAKRRLYMISNHLLATRKSPQIRADFPVAQNLTIRARGHLAPNQSGGQTFVVFQILQENSGFPFESLDIERQKYEGEDRDNGSNFPVISAATDRSMTTSNPVSRYIRRILENHVIIKNANKDAIRVTKLYVSSRRTVESNTAVPIAGDEHVQLSTQPESPYGEQPVATATVESSNGQDDQTSQTTDYQMPLDEFEQMVKKLEGRRTTMANGQSCEIINFKTLRQDVYQRTLSGRMRVSLREVYSKSSNQKRQCLYVSFCYGGKNVCLVEIDQTGLPVVCSTYVLISQTSLGNNVPKDFVQKFIEGEKLETVKSSLRSSGIIMESKHHPCSSSDNHLELWRKRLLEIIEKS